jgi:hypothetical protein
VNYTDDGTTTTATAGSGGQTIPAGSCIPYRGNFSALQVIEQTLSAIVGISFYFSATQ